jgi:hypothetical protein
MEIRFSLANGMFKMKMDIDGHGPRPMPNNCKNLNPPNFSLPSTFKVKTKRKSHGIPASLMVVVLQCFSSFKIIGIYQKFCRKLA